MQTPTRQLAPAFGGSPKPEDNEHQLLQQPGSMGSSAALIRALRIMRTEVSSVSNSVCGLQQRLGVVLQRGQQSQNQVQPGSDRLCEGCCGSSSNSAEAAEQQEILDGMSRDLERAQEALSETLPLLRREMMQQAQPELDVRGDTGAAPDEQSSSACRADAPEAEEQVFKGPRKSIGPPMQAQRGKLRSASLPKASPAVSTQVAVSSPPPVVDSAAFSSRNSEAAAGAAKPLSSSRRQSPRQSSPRPADAGGPNEDVSIGSPGSVPWRPAPWVPPGPITSTVSRSRSTTQLSVSSSHAPERGLLR
eukprot:TRINITY_DN6042_c0_g1_i2.p1 TRINITY_DN6042_c0_g1~~TRINITY_DN6042_c0_g1_i2.p1  ORF type:complete len:305 (-),score=62.54 TRINITY_DN6042_c0_g1_i2:14-928(-)